MGDPTYLSPAPITKQRTLGSEDDSAFMFDLHTIAKKQPGRGAAFQRMLDRAATTQTALADALNLTRSTVTHWCMDDRWPDDPTMRTALLRLNVDRRLLVKVFGPMLVHSDAEIDPQALAVTVVSSLFGEDDPFERETIIYDTIWEKTLICQGIRALTDTRAAVFFAEQRQKHEDLRRLRASETALNVTPKAQAWSSGQSVYEPAKKRNTSPPPGDDAPARAISGDVKDGE